MNHFKLSNYYQTEVSWILFYWVLNFKIAKFFCSTNEFAHHGFFSKKKKKKNQSEFNATKDKNVKIPAIIFVPSSDPLQITFLNRLFAIFPFPNLNKEAVQILQFGVFLRLDLPLFEINDPRISIISAGNLRILFLGINSNNFNGR